MVALALTFLGFVGVLTENKPVIEAYSFILFVITSVMLVSSFMLSVYSSSFRSFFSSNWGDLMVYIHKDFFTPEYMGCYGGKYRNN